MDGRNDRYHCTPRAGLAGEADEGDDRPLLVHRVQDIHAAMDDFESRGRQRGQTLEITHRPICSFTTPAGHRLAIYQLTRPEVGEHLGGMRDC